MDWFTILQGLYERGKIDEDRLITAVTKKIITDEERLKIITV